MERADEDPARQDLYASLEVNQFRLCRIARRSANASIELVLETHNLDEVPEYIALSYCWGDDLSSILCMCNSDMSIDITETLLAALNQCVPDYDGYWWVDQICIDQQSQLDKAQQIPNMGAIYSKASKVITWLGTADDQTPLAFGMLQDFVNQAEKQPGKKIDWSNFESSLVLAPVDDPAWDALNHLIDRHWFQRTWTIQEFWLAKSLCLVCGPYSINWDQVINFCLTVTRPTLRRQARISAEFVREFMVWFNLRICNRSDAASLDPDFVLRSVMSRKASVPHDKVYGILAMFERSGLEDLTIDYHAPYQAVFASFTKRTIAYHQDLATLQYKRVQPEVDTMGPVELPSWIPDLRYPHVRDNNDRRATAVLVARDDERLFHATGSSKCKVDIDDSVSLKLRGVRVSTLTTASLPSQTLRDQWIGANVLKFGEWWKVVQNCGGSYILQREKRSTLHSLEQESGIHS